MFHQKIRFCNFIEQELPTDKIAASLLIPVRASRANAGAYNTIPM